MPEHTSNELHPLADIIDHFASAEKREWMEVMTEMEELAALYRNVMKYPLPDVSDRFSTENRIEALRVMRHYLPNDEEFDEEHTPANLAT